MGNGGDNVCSGEWRLELSLLLSRQTGQTRGRSAGRARSAEDRQGRRVGLDKDKRRQFINHVGHAPAFKC